VNPVLMSPSDKSEIEEVITMATKAMSNTTQYIPINAMTCIPYSEGNAKVLTAAAERMNVLNDPRWLTYGANSRP